MLHFGYLFIHIVLYYIYNVNIFIQSYNEQMLIVNLHNVKWKKHYTRDDIVKGAKVSPATVTKMLKGDSNDFRLKTIEKVAQFLGCNALDIIIEIPDEE